MSKNQLEHTTEAKLVSAETIVAGGAKERDKRIAVKAKSPTAQGLNVRDEHSSAKTAPEVVKNGNMASASVDHPNQSDDAGLLMQALGTEDIDFARGLIIQVARADLSGDFLLSVIKGVKPKDQLEAMLAAQIAATHNLVMRFARRLNHVDTIEELDSVERAFNKLARTFTTQMETLKRYQTGGDQKVTVQQVSVSEGGQAIVGNVTQSVGETAPDKTATSPPALSDARMAPMPMVGNRERVPVELPREQKDEPST